MIQAAGILFLASNGNALFLKRCSDSDYPGAWCFPGGKIEGPESPEQAAVREAKEEIGALPSGRMVYHTRSRMVVPEEPGPEGSPASEEEQVDFTTFLQRVDAEFQPTLDAEHVGYAWAPVISPPEPLHPGCRIALDRLSMDELGVARAMASGALTSPQRYQNVTLWAMRITGTGVALRSATKDAKGNVIRGEEFPWRDPALYLNDDFLARCSGLAVVWLHPKKSVLDSDAYAESVIGSIMLPYIVPEAGEVWGIAKIYDDDANKAMDSGDLSTSPAVILSDPSSPSYKMTLESGETLLIEGKPSLVDHLCVCPLGVWDKGGPPSGIRVDSVEPRTPKTRGRRANRAFEYKLDLALAKNRNARLDGIIATLSRR